jgi:hypothetical protein
MERKTVLQIISTMLSLNTKNSAAIYNNDQLSSGILNFLEKKHIIDRRIWDDIVSSEKACPLCDRLIDDQATSCPHCGEILLDT